MDEVPIDPGGIRLGQFLKLAGLIDTGGQAKAVLGADEVLVNGRVEVRRGCQLVRGDEVTVAARTVRVG